MLRGLAPLRADGVRRWASRFSFASIDGSVFWGAGFLGAWSTWDDMLGSCRLRMSRGFFEGLILSLSGVSGFWTLDKGPHVGEPNII